MTFPNFVAGEILRAQDMNAVGLWKVASGTLSLTTIRQNVLGVFSSNFKNYRLILNVTARSTTNRFDMHYLVGATLINSNYYQAGLGSDYAANTVLYYQRTNNDSQFFFDAAGGQANYSIDIMSPQLNTSTRHYGQTSNGSNATSYAFGGGQLGINQCTGLQFYTNTGTMTMEYSIYGYQN
jgi:hypothetical protein